MNARENAEQRLLGASERGVHRGDQQSQALVGIGWALLELAEAVRETYPKAKNGDR